ncbi:MAG: type II toxin-antitoxin system VapB family antitoxin [Candidatus Electrothrix sp. LOE1_4_5]|nr:type II toxin-antitoxin system VapB family antitoxin [Candidatus Electrothrix sp. AX1]MCI5118450.1 type II toxin-antitoxin system VapB family antitoxin [Candidatus Electrothrix gigas]MCI5178835.1 type II toxin-antitoxin system VapB family antitoxin [Candidatus Electrothrix gigas]MCI5183092.1 type II toxin-antitoxin system VapB family antitoxin [Candidatus Electrothrix gigas]MCI5193127.1 type II toxin-antitoxin system VapB family antitoxin [Candidatus Electrothrix gigas]
MRTTLNIDDFLFQDLMDITRAKTKTEAVRTALTEYLRMKRKEKVLNMRGKLNINDDWQKLRQQEMTESEEYNSERID